MMPEANNKDADFGSGHKFYNFCYFFFLMARQDYFTHYEPSQL